MSKLVILNGNPGGSSFELDSYLVDLENLLLERAHEVSILALRKMEIRHCTGCWGCWVKTPGECVQADDAARVCRAFIGADVVIPASPVIMGFTSALLKKATDRLIPLIHPYFEIIEGEFHHQGRYEKYPLLGLVLEKTPGTDEEDIRIISDIFSRNALNMRSQLCFVKLTSSPVQELADEIDRL